MALTLSDDKKAGIFRTLASATLYEVGVQFELDKHYKDPTAVRNKVYQIYREVLNDPGRFSVHPDTAKLVEAAVSIRKIATRTTPTLAEVNSAKAISATDIKELTIASRNRAGRLIGRKLEYMEAHPKVLAMESLVNLGKIFGILFDKAQIIQGQATEHLAIMSKIDPSMSAEQSLDMVLRMRETTSADKYA